MPGRPKRGIERRIETATPVDPRRHFASDLLKNARLVKQSSRLIHNQASVSDTTHNRYFVGIVGVVIPLVLNYPRGRIKSLSSTSRVSRSSVDFAHP
jgi:hypothetical protein